MKLHEAILIESPTSDMEMRQRAQIAYRELLRAFERIGGLSGMQEYRNAYAASESTLRHPDDIKLVIMDRSNDRSKMGGIEVDSRTLFLFLYFDRDIVSQLKTSDTRTTIIHEFIHLYDYERMDVMRSTAQLPNDQYFNDPSETNAYYQEAVDRFEETVRRLSPKARQIHIGRVQRNFHDFLSLMDKMMSDDFVDWRSARTERNLQKRLYRYWDEVVRRMSL